MNLSDHLRPLLRDHDCVIIPDFGGLVAEYTSARVQPGGRHILSPPTRQVAFNQALTRNDGLLLDALCQLGLPAAEAREAVRVAVATLHQELQAQQRTELPGIGVFRQVAGRGLQFEYTGTDNLLAAAFGLPELTAHPVRVTDVRLAREQQAQLVPRLRSAGRGLRWRRVLPGATIGLLAGLAVAGLYLLNLYPAAAPVAWRSYVPRWEQGQRTAAPQQAALAQPSLVTTPVAILDTPVAATTTETVSSEEASAEVATAKLASPATASPEPASTPRLSPAAANNLVSLEEITPKVASVEVATTDVSSLPQQVVGQTPDPVEVLLARPTPVRKKGKVPVAAIPAAADESNIARPVPLARRLAGATTTKAPAAASAAPKAIVPKAAVPAPHAVAPVVHTAPAAHAPVPVAHAATVGAHRVVLGAHPAKVVPVRPVVNVHSSRAVTVVPAKPAVAKAPAPVAVTAPMAATATTTIKARTGRYYIIVAAYGSLAKAELGRRNLAHAGRPAKVIMPPAGSRLYRLSAADFADRPAATVAATQLRQNPHFDKGLTIYPY